MTSNKICWFCEQRPGVSKRSYKVNLIKHLGTKLNSMELTRTSSSQSAIVVIPRCKECYQVDRFLFATKFSLGFGGFILVFFLVLFSNTSLAINTQIWLSLALSLISGLLAVFLLPKPLARLRFKSYYKNGEFKDSSVHTLRNHPDVSKYLAEGFTFHFMQ